jgi:hypothetical protein
MILARMALVKIIIYRNGNSDNNNHPRIIMDCAQCIRGYIAIGTLTLLSACGGGGDAPPILGGDAPPIPGGDGPPIPLPTGSTGVFVDGVAGLHYDTPTFSGNTNNAGEYHFLPGETVTFSIGDIVLGSTTAGQVVSPLTLVSGATGPTDPVVTNIVRFLLTLDDDGNPDNGITISVAVEAATAGLSVDFTIADLSTDTGVIALLAAIRGPPTLVSSAVAQAHFTEILATTLGIMRWGSGTWKAAAGP